MPPTLQTPSYLKLPSRFQTLLDDLHLQVQTHDKSACLQSLKAAISKIDAFLDDEFAKRTEVSHIVHGRALLIDKLLAALWEYTGLAQSYDIALLAVGGYGRAELHPCSDLDLLILMELDQRHAHTDEIGFFITSLWDIGLKIGHSVRTLQECVEAAEKDLTVMTNLLEARTIIGNDDLRLRLNALTSNEHMWSASDFFSAKREEQYQRHFRYQHTDHSLEPNVKNAPGALRDIQTIGWVAKRFFGATRLYGLMLHGFLQPEEYQQLLDGQNFLWLLRYGLHRIAKRPEDRLLFDYQVELAKELGYRQDDCQLAVEQLMQDYYLTVMHIGVLNEMLLQYFSEAVLQAAQTDTIVTLNERFRVRNQYLEVCHPNVFPQSPSALIELFVILANNPNILGIRASTIRLIQQHSQLIDEASRKDKEISRLFMQLLSSPHGLATQLTRMKRYGILGRYLYEFGNIIGQTQHDLFHIYTVDAHTLQVIKNMRRFRYENMRERFPVAARIIHDLPRVDLLYIAGLYHDIAKGRGGDHSELGALDVTTFCQDHHLGRWETNLVTWLVKNHLLMSMVAQRKDISDPNVIQEFATEAGDQIRLDYLYLLTVADICGTNPALWNSWRASLLHQLYSETKRILRRGLETPVDQLGFVQQNQHKALEQLEERGVSTRDILTLWQGLGLDYFTRHRAEEIAWQTEIILKSPKGLNQENLVAMRNLQSSLFEGGTEIFLYAKNKIQLFAVIAAAMEQLHLSIHDARIVTTRTGKALHSYIILGSDGQPLSITSQRAAYIQKTLEQTVLEKPLDSDRPQRHIPRQLKHFKVMTEITFSFPKDQRYTIMEVITADRPGLLAKIGSQLAAHRLQLLNAKISTLGERVVDVFFLTEEDATPMISEPVQNALEQTLTAELDQLSDITQ